MPSLDPGAGFSPDPGRGGRLDLPSLGHNSSAYLHTVIESTKLAFADREAYYGDPEFDQVPLDTLLSKEYASMRREMIEWEASQQLRPGDLGQGVPQYAIRDVAEDNRLALGVAAGQIQDLGWTMPIPGTPHIWTRWTSRETWLHPPLPAVGSGLPR